MRSGFIAIVTGGIIAAASLATAQMPDLEAREQAVTSGFAWLRSVQADDGSWSFADQERFANAGSDRSRVKSTALAMLAMVSAGQTHKEGDHREHLGRGLKYLLAQQKDDGDWRGEHGDVTAHALASVAVCELYAMTNDKSLKEPAQNGISFLQKSQNKNGGWSNQSGKASDLSVAVWCLMALKSAHMAYLTVDVPMLKSANGFLTSVRVKDQPRYGFKSPDAEPLATAMGLIMAVWLGQKELRESGVVELVKSKSSLVDAEFRYFGMLTIKDSRAEKAIAWRTSVQDRLVASQSSKERERGSWFDEKDRSAANGGRLYQTALNLIVLVMRPNKFLIERQAPEDDFPL